MVLMMLGLDQNLFNLHLKLFLPTSKRPGDRYTQDGVSLIPMLSTLPC